MGAGPGRAGTREDAPRRAARDRTVTASAVTGRPVAALIVIAVTGVLALGGDVDEGGDADAEAEADAGG